MALRPSTSGDSKECINSRTDFLSLGYYEPISDEIARLLREYAAEDPLIIDAGSGEGYYTNRLASLGRGNVIGFDISKFGASHGAKTAKASGRQNAFFAVASLFDMPIRDGAADAVVSIFAPCAETEFARVLKSGGVLVTAAAGKKHLLGLKKALYDEVYENSDRADMPTGLSPIFEKTLEYRIELRNEKEIADLFSMTPYFYRTSERDKAKLAALKTLETEIEIVFSVYGG